MKALTLIVGTSFFCASLSTAAPTLVSPVHAGNKPELLNEARAADREQIAVHLSRVVSYLAAAPPKMVNAESAKMVQDRVNAWLISPKSNPFADDPVFARTVRAMLPYYLSAKGTQTTARQILSCQSKADHQLPGAVYRFYEPTTGEHRYFTSLAEGCLSRLRLEGRAFVTMPTGLAGTTGLRVCQRDGVTFVSSDAKCEGATVIRSLGAVYTKARKGLVPLYSSTHNSDGSRLITTSHAELSLAKTVYGKDLRTIGYVIPSGLEPIVSVPKGHFKIKNSLTISYSNGDGLFCDYANPTDLLALGGRVDGSNIQDLNAMPKEMKRTGTCSVPKVPAGPLTTKDGPGPDVYLARNCGYDCAQQEIRRLYYSNGGNLVCSFATLNDYFAPGNSTHPLALDADRRPEKLDPSLIYVGTCGLTKSSN